MKKLSNKLQMFMLNMKIKFLNKFVASKDEYYSLTEPSMEMMDAMNKKFWIQPYKEEQ